MKWSVLVIKHFTFFLNEFHKVTEYLDSINIYKFNENEYHQLINEMSYFTMEWEKYFENEKIPEMTNYELSDDQLELAVDMAKELKNRTVTVEKKHDEYLILYKSNS